MLQRIHAYEKFAKDVICNKLYEKVTKKFTKKLCKKNVKYFLSDKGKHQTHTLIILIFQLYTIFM